MDDKVCIRPIWLEISYIDIHEIAGRGTPTMMGNYFNANMLFNIFNYKTPDSIYNQLISNSCQMTRASITYFAPNCKNKYGQQSFENRVMQISKKIPFGHYDLSMAAFKKQTKTLFINWTYLDVINILFHCIFYQIDGVQSSGFYVEFLFLFYFRSCWLSEI